VVGSDWMMVWFSSKMEPQYGGETGALLLHSKNFGVFCRGEEFLGDMPLLYSCLAFILSKGLSRFYLVFLFWFKLLLDNN